MLLALIEPNPMTVSTILRKKEKVTSIEIRGLSKDGQINIACTLILIPKTHRFVTYHGAFGRFGQSYARLLPSGEAIPGKTRFPKIRDIFCARRYTHVTRQVPPKIPGVYLFTTYQDTPETKGLNEHFHLCLHEGKWYQVRENTFQASRLGMDYLTYSTEHGNNDLFAA